MLYLPRISSHQSFAHKAAQRVNFRKFAKQVALSLSIYRNLYTPTLYIHVYMHSGSSQGLICNSSRIRLDRARHTEHRKLQLPIEASSRILFRGYSYIRGEHQAGIYKCALPKLHDLTFDEIVFFRLVSSVYSAIRSRDRPDANSTFENIFLALFVVW